MSLTQTEQKYVYETYDYIARDFSHSRAYLWESVKSFMNRLPPHSLVLEVGCGNGKNLSLSKRSDLLLSGCDLTQKFCHMTNSKGFDCPQVNNLCLPYRDSSFDYLLSIAVIHHLSSSQRRLECIREMIRVLKPNGELLLQVWAKEQPTTSRRQFIDQDNLVSWQNPSKTKTAKRFYHVFEKDELKHLIQPLLSQNQIQIIHDWYEIGNWIVLLKKL